MEGAGGVRRPVGGGRWCGGANGAGLGKEWTGQVGTLRVDGVGGT